MIKCGRLIAGAVVCAVLHVPSVEANGFTAVQNRGDHSWNDSLDWAQIGTCENALANPLAPPPVSVHGIHVATTLQSGPGMGTEQMTLVVDADGNPQYTGGCPVDLLWPGNFQAGDALLFTSLPFGGPEEGFGPLTLDFDRPVQGVGTQFQSFAFFVPFTAQIDAYGATGFLGSVTNHDGFSDASADNSAAFLGIFDPTGAHITRVVLSVFSEAVPCDPEPVDPPCLSDFFPGIGNFAVNQLAIDAPLQPEPPGEVPEPASLALVATGVAVAAHLRRRSA